MEPMAILTIVALLIGAFLFPRLTIFILGLVLLLG